jgi:hypothetical protein
VLSTRNIEDAFTDERGRRLLSPAAVSEITERLWAEYEAFSKLIFPNMRSPISTSTVSLNASVRGRNGTPCSPLGHRR